MRVPYSGACSCGRLFDLLLPPSMVVYGVPPGPAWPQAVLFSSLLKVVTTGIALLGIKSWLSDSAWGNLLSQQPDGT